MKLFPINFAENLMMKQLFLAFLFLSVIGAQPTVAQRLSFFDFRPNRDRVELTKAITAYNIGADQDLYLLLSPLASLQNELAKLAPALKTEELTLKGNYHLDFLVDGKIVYAEKLHPGAILPEDKTTNRPLDIVFISGTRSGVWSINLWDRFMFNAGKELLNEQPKSLEIQIKVYIDNNGLKYSEVLATAQLTVTRIPKPINPAEMVPQPIAPGSGFKVSHSPIDQQLITALNTKIADKSYRMINGIVILKKGELLLEQYYNGESRATLHDSRSVTKSITATMVGMAIRDGFIASENQYLKEFYPLKQYANYSSKKDSVKLLDLLTMSSAFDGNDDIDASPGNEENMYPTADYTKFALDLPMVSGIKNGERWSYFTAGTHLLMDIVDQKVAGGAEKYVKRKFFDPLGISTYEWARTPQGKPFGGGGLRLRALDLAKYGQLYSDGGRFGGKRLLEKSWVVKSLSPLRVLPAANPGFYGLLFWNKTFHIKNKAYEVYYSSGNGGNKIYIFTNLPLVIVVTASAYGRSFAHPQVDEMMEKYLLPAVL